jgi:hypothetical protein
MTEPTKETDVSLCKRTPQSSYCNTKRKDKYGNYYYLPDDLVAELRSKNPYHENTRGYDDGWNIAWAECCSELEKLLKEKVKK